MWYYSWIFPDIKNEKFQGHNQDLNWPLQDIAQNYDDDVNIMVWRQYREIDRIKEKQKILSIVLSR